MKKAIDTLTQEDFHRAFQKGRICYKSDVTFVLANYYCVRTSLLLEIMAFAFKCNSLNSASTKNAKVTSLL